MEFKFIKKYSVLVIIALTVGLSYAQQRSQVFVGARPLGLGEAFVAVADDGNAVYWNPAGLPTLKRIEFNSTYTNLYNIPGFRNTYLSFVYPLTNRYSIGLSYFHLGFDDDVLEYYRNKMYLTFGATVFHNLSLGGTFKYLSTDARLDGTSEGKASGFGFDFGVFYSLKFPNIRFLKQINLGIVAYDVDGTSITYRDTHQSEDILPQSIRYGISFFPKDEISLRYFSLKNSLLTFDFDDRFHMGMETWLFDHVGLRSGLQKDFHTQEDLVWSIGSSIKIPYISMQFDYTYVIHPVLPASHFLSFSLIPSLSPVKITEVNVDDLYASFYQSYATSKIGYATIRNDYDKPLKLRMTVSIPDLSEEEITENVFLDPDQEKIFAFSTLLSKNVLNIIQPEFKQLKIRVDYTIKNEAKHTETTKGVRIYGRGAITWENPGKAAAFITKLDRMVELFALEATKSLTYRSEFELGNIYTAAALFDAMSAVGIRYSEDPANPFSVIPKNQYSVDHIQYPAETLINKRGDCDDLTVLYASLLGYSGIKTALLSTIDHITLLFDTGIHERNWGIFPSGDSLFVIRNKTFWIPIEITEIGQAFSKAWQTGYHKYQSWKDDEHFQVVYVRNVEGIYLSSSPEEYQDRIPDLPGNLDIQSLLESDFTWIEDRKTHMPVRQLKLSLARDPLQPVLKNKLGIIYAHLDSMAEAEMQFRDILAQEPDHMNACVNLANVQCATGRFQEAERTYTQVLNKYINEPGIPLNLSILYQIWKHHDFTDSTRLQQLSEKHLLRAFELLEGNETRTLDLLGIPSTEFILGEKADFKSWVKSKTQAVVKFVKENTKKYLLNKSVKGARLKRQGVKRGVDNDRRYILWWARDEKNTP